MGSAKYVAAIFAEHSLFAAFLTLSFAVCDAHTAHATLEVHMVLLDVFHCCSVFALGCFYHLLTAFILLIRYHLLIIGVHASMKLVKRGCGLLELVAVELLHLGPV